MMRFSSHKGPANAREGITPMKKKPEIKEAHGRPRLSRATAKHAWFVYEGRVYEFANCPTKIFKAAFGKYKGPSGDIVDLLKEKELDLYSRWYLQNYRAVLKLYNSREEAEGSLVKS